VADIPATRIIVLCLRWYLRYPLSYRNLQEMMAEREEMMAERRLKLDHSTTARWVLLYAPVLNERIRLEMRWPNRSWRVDETHVRSAGTWTYLYWAIDSAGIPSTFCCHLSGISQRPKPSSSRRRCRLTRVDHA
jgi:transposase-like protein